jgi:hypothetical protein
MNDQRSPDPPGLRASDAERDEAAEGLRRHHAQGRLRDDEFEERIERCYDARTVAQLDGLMSDLPGEDRPRRDPGRAFVRRGGPPVAVLVLGLFAVMALLGSVTGYHHHHYGGGHPPLFLLIGLAFIAYRVLRARGWRSGGR